jgi:NAD(P)H-flavin reductase
MDLHLQPDWQRALGQYVEIWMDGRPYRTGFVDAVMPDNSLLWIAAEGQYTREIIAKYDGYRVFTHDPQSTQP